MIRSPLRYPGGKSRAINQIIPLIPDFEAYREPFVGGGSVFVHLKQLFPERQYWINDLYFELFTFWQACQQDVQGLINQIRTWKSDYPEGKDLHTFLKKTITERQGIELAAAFFIFNRITFSGTSEAGGFSQAAFKGRFTESSIERLPPIAKILQNTRITNEDYEQVVRESGNDVFLFLDPPYYSATASALYGKNGKLHKTFDHERLADVLKQCPHRFLMTYDDSPYIRRLFAFANIVPWKLTYGMKNITPTSQQSGNELFISNYDLPLVAVKQSALAFEER